MSHQVGFIIAAARRCVFSPRIARMTQMDQREQYNTDGAFPEPGQASVAPKLIDGDMDQDERK